MPSFAYVARDLKGQRVTGTLDAATQREALGALSGQSLFPVEVAEAKAKTTLRGRRVSGRQIATMYAQLAALLRSGVPLLRSINVLREQATNRKLREVLDDVHHHVEEGDSLAVAMAHHPRVFGEMAVNMVQAGGEGGFLEDALDRVAQFTDQKEDLKSRTIGALAYPVFLATVGTIVVTVLLVFFVPRFAEIFDHLRRRGELPILTEGLLGFSNALRSWGWVVVVVVAAGVFWARSRIATPEGRRVWDRWKLKLPLFGGIYQNLAISRFCRVLGTLLKNGVSILKSMEISSKAAGNRVLCDAIDRASESISSGDSIAPPLAGSGHFPRNVVEMIAVAEESNTLDKVLVEIADGLEKQTLRRMDLMVRLLEPIMLLLLAGAVLMVVLALLLPMVRMLNTV
jgi:general secretion pathway protein F/type IV pilus assembly protein PilC